MKRQLIWVFESRKSVHYWLHIICFRMQIVNLHARPSITQMGWPTCCCWVCALNHAKVGDADLDYLSEPCHRNERGPSFSFWLLLRKNFCFLLTALTSDSPFSFSLTGLTECAFVSFVDSRPQMLEQPLATISAWQHSRFSSGISDVNVRHNIYQSADHESIHQHYWIHTCLPFRVIYIHTDRLSQWLLVLSKQMYLKRDDFLWQEMCI